jgi:ATP-dependent DNA helicase Q1
VQLEKVIGKLKTQKYGNKILEHIVKFTDFKPTDEQVSDGRAAKKSKTKKNLVLIESSEDEA